MQAYLDIVPTNDRDGCLQDVHWYAGSMGGAFQSYTIGNILSAQFRLGLGGLDSANGAKVVAFA
jgi:Zn-dependent M32 family carboxypeptidase